jgi:4-diphosphocytidyl-2-C-methyl-D-erythritol kinase
VTLVRAHAKLNLGLVVGGRRDDGLHEVATVMQRLDLADTLEVEPAATLAVEGFPEDTLVGAALEALAREAAADDRWRVRIEKEIPVAAGLGGGSADAAAALLAANATLADPLPAERLHGLAAPLGADVPFFLDPGPKLAEGAGERLTALDLPQDYAVVVALDPAAEKTSTAGVYARFDELGGGPGFAERRDVLLRALAALRTPRDLALLPPNDLAPAAAPTRLPEALLEAGAFRADVSGAGPAVYGLFDTVAEAETAALALSGDARVWVAQPVW